MGIGIRIVHAAQQHVLKRLLLPRPQRITLAQARRSGIVFGGMFASTGEVTQLLSAWNQGDASALDRLMTLVEPELRRVARAYVWRERKGQSIEPDLIVNETYLRLAQCRAVPWQGEAHFMSVAAKIMRRILVDHARQRARRTAGSPVTMSFAANALSQQPKCVDVIALERAMDKLAAFDERKARLVELRFYGGLGEDETAESLGVSVRTAQREWNLARAWLFRELQP